MYSIPQAPSSIDCPQAPIAVVALDGAWVKGLLGSVQAGFPSPAEDHGVERIDLNKELIKHPQATFMMRVRGASMREAGIDDGDVVLVDRAIKPSHGHVVVAVVDGEFTVKRLWKRGSNLKLQAANPTYPDILPRDGQTVEVWGVVTTAIKSMRV
ncbi:LexA family protein [Paucibacter sp. KCTC 42545]|uniref:LexA family protein n=1 Tax=Paucibacter sp. KCTC 42545 TaxID=1768242 RepID=UPI0009EB0A18|nr:translesion error-prone DNA polymerase V autoproteolytic subunit [Paucibacter sp. KCTC 42545]